MTEIAGRYGLTASTHDIVDVGPSLGNAKGTRDLDVQARAILERILAADVLVVGSPTYKGSYTGLFKHFFDLVDPAAPRGKPVLLAATGGGDRHALIVEHQLRSLFGFFEAFALPTAVFASEKDFVDACWHPKRSRPVSVSRWTMSARRFSAGNAPGSPPSSVLRNISHSDP